MVRGVGKDEDGRCQRYVLGKELKSDCADVDADTSPRSRLRKDSCRLQGLQRGQRPPCRLQID